MNVVFKSLYSWRFVATRCYINMAKEFEPVWHTTVVRVPLKQLFVSILYLDVANNPPNHDELAQWTRLY
jgi:hypothetical protein